MDSVAKILQEYAVLRIKGFEGVQVDEEELWIDYGGYQLVEDHFSWVRFSDRRRSSQSRVYDGSPQVFCATKRKCIGVVEALNGETLRLPKISYCYGNESIMVADEMLEGLEFAPNLGIVTTAATILDITKTKQQGYTALSFHKQFNADRIAQRLLKLPPELRPLINLRRGKHETQLLVLKGVLAKWQALDVREIEYETDNFSKPLKEILLDDNFYISAPQLCYDGMENYQLNQGD